MFYHRRYKNLKKDGIVVVSISNLFHLLDLSQNGDEEKLNSQKNTFHSLNSSKPNTFKEKDTFQTIKSGNNELEIESMKDRKENKIEESKDLIIEKDVKIRESKYNINIDTKKENNSNITTLTGIRKFAKRFNIKNKRKKYCDYFIILVLCIFTLLIFNNSFLWILCYMVSAPKNKTYCYNHYLKEFEICIKSNFCPNNGIHDFIYIEDDNLSDVELKKEINNINNKYLKFYNYESTIFSKINKKFIKNENTLSKYSATIILTKNEKYLFNNTFRVECESYLFGLLLLIAISSIFGTFFFGLLADIFGRKKMLIIVNIIEIIGGISLFIETYFIIKYDKEEIFRNKFNNEFSNDFSLYFNESIYFTSDYINNYIDIKNEVIKSKIINNNFKNYYIFIFFSFFLIFLSNSSIKIISLSYLIENALTEEKMMLYFLFFNLAQPISILLSTMMTIYLNSFHFPILICSIIISIITIFIIIFFFESQRFNFEYCFYSQITEFTEYIIGKNELNKNYKVKEEIINNNMESHINEKENVNNYGILYSYGDYRIQSELNNEKINQNTFILDAFKFTKKSFYNELYSRHIIKQYKSNNLIERFIIFKNPIYIFKLIFKDKHIKKKSNIILAFIINISIVINLPLQRITSNYLFQREKLINENIFSSHLFLNIVLLFIILFPFAHYLTKCFGIYIFLFSFLVLICLCSFIFEFVCLVVTYDNVTDLTKYNSRTNDKLADYKNNYLLPSVIIITISIIGLDYVSYFVVLKLTKTIYRCSLLSIAQIFYSISFIFGIGLEESIRGSYYYAGIFSFISLINSFFINYSEDSLNISDIREIIYDENKNNDK